MSHRPLRALLATSAVGVLLVSGCGSDSDDATDTTTTTEAAGDATTTTSATPETTDTEPSDTEPTDSSTTGPVDPDAQARAEAVDLEAADLGEGWTGTPGDDAESEAFGDCDLEPDAADVIGSHSSDDFSKGDLDANDGQQLAVSTKVFVDAEAATAAVDLYDDDAAVSCINEGLKAQFGPTVTVDGEVANIGFEVDAEQSVAVAGNLEISAPGEDPVTLEIAILVVRTGDVASAITALAVNQDPDQEAFQVLVEAVLAAQAA